MFHVPVQNPRCQSKNTPIPGCVFASCPYRLRRVFSCILPSLSSVSYFSLFSSFMSFRPRCTRGDFSRAKYRCFLSRFKMPEPCTRFVKRRIRFAVLSWLFFCTSTFVAICGQRIPRGTLVCKRDMAVCRTQPILSVYGDAWRVWPRVYFLGSGVVNLGESHYLP